MSNTHPMVLAAARAWCRRHAELTTISEAESWREFSEQFIAEAQGALEACGALELLESTRNLLAFLESDSIDDQRTDARLRAQAGEAHERARAAVAKAEGRA